MLFRKAANAVFQKDARLVFHKDSRLLWVLLFIASPTALLPRLLPLCVQPARVGTNCTDFVTVTWGK
tara:strand:+ start:473 stop:673 length:201 start_codon:yes stop_codon:yes gene_type:complete